MVPFVSLHNHTYYSILDALSSPKEIFQRAKDLGQTAIAITDHGTFAGVWDAYKAAKAVGIKYIVGAEFYFVSSVSNTEERIRHVILIAKNAVGYRNILTLNRRGFDHSVYYGKKTYPLIDWDLLERHSEGVVCLTSCGNGIVSQLLNNKKFSEAEDTIKRLVGIFGDNLGLEIQSHNLKRFANGYNDQVDQDFTNSHLIRLGKKLGVRIVPTVNSHYINKEDAETHDVFLAIGSGQNIYSNARLKYDNPNFHIKSGDEVREFFARKYEDSIDEWMANSVYFGDLCENPDWIDPKYSNKSGKELPVFPVKDEPDYQVYLQWLSNQSVEIQSYEEDKSFILYRCEEAFPKLVPAGKEAEYRARLEEELSVIDYCGINSYMLIVADYVNWAKNNGVHSGPGRGSGGGSLVGYLIGIHIADPIKYGLVFERFHNRLKTSYSDIDCDFSTAGRGKVIQYVNKKYGQDFVAHVSNINTITPKVFARDVARACELGGSRETAVKIGTDVADSIPKDAKSIASALEGSGLFAEYVKRHPHFTKFSSLCGKHRNFSTHAGGILISKRQLTGLVPLRKDKDGSVAIEYDKDQAEENGLVKMDILGLSTLDVIDLTNEIIVKSGKALPIIDYDQYDKKTYDLISSGNNFGIFQFGTSAGTIDLCRKIKPICMEDLGIITAIARPAVKEIREPFVETRNGQRQVTLIHPLLKRAFATTLGFPLYDESLLILAKDVAGWDLGEADKLRKLTKEKGKNPAKVKKWKEDFIQGANKNGVQTATAEKIWTDIVEPFGRYGFNKSHAILYSMVSFHTAYLKAHFPIEFLLANLIFELRSNALDSDKKIERCKQELRAHKINILPPNLNESSMTYRLTDSGTLLTGLDALRNVGDDAIADIIQKRPFRDFFDFMSRVSSSVRSNTIQALAVTGCLDDFGLTRKQIYYHCADYRKKLTAWLKKHNPKTETFVYPWPEIGEWSKSEIYALEKKYLGEAFVCGKLDAYGSFFKDTQAVPIKRIRSACDKMNIPSMRVEVKDCFEFKIKKVGSKFLGKEMMKVVVEDVNGDQCGMTIFPDQLKLVKERLKQISSKAKFEPGIAICFSGTTNLYEEEVGVLLNNIYDYAPHPAEPADKQHRKVSLKNTRKINGDDDSLSGDKKEDLFESIQDELFDEGYIENDGDWDDNDN